MKNTTLTLIAAAVSLAFGASAMANSMTKTEYQAAKKNIAADYKTAKTGCDPLLANVKDICMAEAKGRENVALAELAATYKPSQKARYDTRIAKAQADYSVAKEKCDDKAGNEKDVCVKQADAALIAAKADAKTILKTADANKAAGEKSTKAHEQANKQIAEVRKDAVVEKRDAEYAVAKEKCDALSGNPKEACITEAKARYSKS
jgi:hypothetical protein